MDVFLQQKMLRLTAQRLQYSHGAGAATLR
jgi:hypothetical protein